MSKTKPRVAEELAVFVGGPWNGWWLTRARLDDNRAAATRLAHPVAADQAGVALGYEPTNQWRDNPDEEHGDGRIWRWTL